MLRVIYTGAKRNFATRSDLSVEITDPEIHSKPVAGQNTQSPKTPKPKIPKAKIPKIERAILINTSLINKQRKNIYKYWPKADRLH